MENNNISLNDIANVVNIIDFAFSKGIFVGPEVVSVGEIRNRFSNIVEEAKKQQEENAGSEVADQETAAPKKVASRTTKAKE